MTKSEILKNASELRTLINNADSRPIPQFFKLRAALPVVGKYDIPLASTSRLWVVLKVYASGGENELHSHPNEDHLFIILQGQADFFGPKGELRTCGKNECVLLPRGTVYCFKAFGDEPLVMLRVGAVVDPADDPIYRVDQNGKEMDGFSVENKHVDAVLGDKFFA